MLLYLCNFVVAATVVTAYLFSKFPWLIMWILNPLKCVVIKVSAHILGKNILFLSLAS